MCSTTSSLDEKNCGIIEVYTIKPNSGLLWQQINYINEKESNVSWKNKAHRSLSSFYQRSSNFRYYGIEFFAQQKINLLIDLWTLWTTHLLWSFKEIMVWAALHQREERIRAWRRWGEFMQSSFSIAHACICTQGGGRGDSSPLSFLSHCFSFLFFQQP